MNHRYLVFATSSYDDYREGLCRFDGFEPGRRERVHFPDGETYQRLTGSVLAQDAVVVGGTISEEETLELYDLASGLVHYGVNTLIMVVPYYGYSTMERAEHYGEIVTGKTRAVLLSSIPRARICNEIVMIDLHTAGIAYYLEGHIRPYHLFSKRLMAGIISQLAGFPDLVLASTDAGRAKWVESLANHLTVPAAFVYKRRLSGEKTEIRGINADVRGKHVVIYDDMIRTGGTLLKAASAYREGGADKITAITTHGLLPGKALHRLRQANLFEKIIATDTHPRAAALAGESGGFLEIHSMIPEIARFLMKRESMDEQGFDS